MIWGKPADACDLERVGPGQQVVEVIDGDTVVLESGREVRLVGTQAPKLPLGRRNFVAWPLADEAQQALEKLVLGRNVQLAHGGREVDRHGRLLAHLYLDDSLWVQGEMVSAGMARVYTFADNRSCVSDLLDRERAAREAAAGIWRHPFYAIRDVVEVDDDIGSFQLVEGTVVSAAVVRGRAYLNFGEDWRSDFTISIAPRDRRLFEAEGYVFEELVGRDLRARGWIEEFNGPVIDATHPEQIELLF